MSPSNVSNVRRTMSLMTCWIATKWTWSLHCQSDFVWQQTRNITVLTMMNRRRSANAKRFEFYETNSNEIANPTVVWVKRSRIGVFASSSEVECAIHSPLVWIRLIYCDTFNWCHSFGTIWNRKVRMCMYNSVRVQFCTRQFGSEGIVWSRISELNT